MSWNSLQLNIFELPKTACVTTDLLNSSQQSGQKIFVVCFQELRRNKCLNIFKVAIMETLQPEPKLHSTNNSRHRDFMS